MENKKRRIELIDEIRGFAIICMVMHHSFYVAAESFDLPISEALFDFMGVLQPYFAALFVVVCGIMCRYSKNNLKRGLVLAGVSACITAVSVFFPNMTEVWFGILHFLAVSILLYVPLKFVFDRVNPYEGTAVMLILFFLTYNIIYSRGAFGYKLPSELYKYKFLGPLGFPSNDFISADYFPLLPWVFAFFTGTSLGIIIKKLTLPEFMYKKHLPFLSFAGRHTLYIYILHFPLIYALLWAGVNLVK